MKTTKLFFMAALALMTAACSNDDNDLTTQQPQKAEGITITATLAPKTGGADTRAVSDGGNKIVADWAENEQLAVLYEVGGTKKVADATITAVDGDGAATIEFTVEAGTPDNTACTLVYPLSAAKDDHTGVKDAATLLAAQDGTLNANLDVRVGAGTIQTTTPGLTVTTQPAAQFAIFKLTLKNIDATADVSATSVVVSDQNGTVTTVTPASGYDKVMYVALPTTATTLKFAVTDGTTNYFNMASGLSLGTNFYQSTIKLATVGDVILSTGKCAKAGTGSPVAMIAYLGNGSECTNGLAIQLNASPEGKNWSTACSYSSYPSITGNPGTWRLPSKADWQNMFVGCAKDGDAGASDSMNPIAGFKEKIGATGITWMSGSYWSSTGSGSNAWRVNVMLGSKALAGFNEGSTSAPLNVLGCLAF